MSDASDSTGAPVRWHTREDSGLRLDRELCWWHDGVRVEHPNIIEAFNRGVQVQPDGRVKLVFGNDWCFVAVDDCQFGITTVDAVPAEGRFSIRLSDRTAEWLEVKTLELGDDGVLVATVKNGAARARFFRDAQFQLMSHAEAESDPLTFRIGSTVVPTELSLPRA